MDAEAALDWILNGSEDDLSSVEELDSSEESLMSSSEEESMDEDQNASNDSSNDEDEYQTESSSDEEDSDDEDGGDDALRGPRRSSIVRGALRPGAVRFAADLVNCPGASFDQLLCYYGNRQPAKVGLARKLRSSAFQRVVVHHFPTSDG